MSEVSYIIFLLVSIQLWNDNTTLLGHSTNFLWASPASPTQKTLSDLIQGFFLSKKKSPMQAGIVDVVSMILFAIWYYLFWLFISDFN